MSAWILQCFKHNNPASRRIEFYRHRWMRAGIYNIARRFVLMYIIIIYDH